MIEVKNLTKRYGPHEAVSNLSFTVENGQIYGFLGPNGAGKTTTMNIMTGCLAATSGDVTINGYDIFEHPMEAKKQIGYLPENPPLYLDRTPLEYLTFIAEAKGIPADSIKKEVASVMAATHITDVANRLNKYLSKGYRQRVGIAQALLGNPDIIILDEPTVGLDPNQILEIRDLIKELGKNHTVILSTHILQEVQAICDQILIISKGKLVACDTPENLESLFMGTTSVELEIEASEKAASALAASMDYIKDYRITSINKNLQSLVLETEHSDEAELCRKIFYACSGANTPILKMVRSKVSLEDVFIELTNTNGAANKKASDDSYDSEENSQDDISLDEYNETEGLNVSIEGSKEAHEGEEDAHE